jgi:carbamoyl-phosphate synthase small subunit
MNGYILFEDGTQMAGQIFGAVSNAVGEVVFNTGMTGYQEIVTDPSYFGQIVVLTYPLIGNYGINSEDQQSSKSHVRGLIVREASDTFSNFRSEESLDSYLKKQGIVGLQGLDTRALVAKIRENGTMKAKIIVDQEPVEYHIDEVKQFTVYRPAQYVTTKEAYTIPGKSGKIAVVDFGIKAGILKMLEKTGYELKVFPYGTPLSVLEAYDADGYFLSNGPGDPAEYEDAIYIVKHLVKTKPIFGICLGHQILSLALGGETRKMKFGHRGSNHPVKDIKHDKVVITAQNHSYEVVSESLLDQPIVITHKHVNDQTIEGFRSEALELLSVQFHPEASPGPHDSHYLFDEFVAMMKGGTACEEVA